MKTNCIRCRIEYETIRGYCKGCYDLLIFKNQCLNIAGNNLKGENPEHPLFLEKLFKLAKSIYEEGQKSCPKDCKENHEHKQRFLEW